MPSYLDSIDWSKISHCYGPATDIPATLRALATGDAKQREHALWELHGNIWHQGTVYEATAAVVPFLLELVSNHHPDSLDILGLLALIADGSSYLAVHGNIMKRDEREYQAQLACELQWVAQAKKAVSSGRALFLEQLEGSDKRVREMCIYLLGLTGPYAGEDASSVEVIEKIRGADS